MEAKSLNNIPLKDETARKALEELELSMGNLSMTLKAMIHNLDKSIDERIDTAVSKALETMTTKHDTEMNALNVATNNAIENTLATVNETIGREKELILNEVREMLNNA